MASLGSLVIQMAVDTAKFQGDLGRAASIAESRLRNIRDTAKKTVGQLAAIGTAVGGALILATKQAIDAADSMRDMAAAAGTTVENMSRLGYAAQKSGADLEMVKKALAKLAKEGAKDSVAALMTLADEFANLPNGAAKTARAVEIFGERIGPGLIPLLNEGRDGLAAMADEADRLGVTISGSAANAADQFNDRMAALTGAITGFKNSLAAEMLPTLNAIAEEMVKTAKNTEALDKAARIAATGLKLLVTGAELTRLVFQQVGEGLGAVAAAIVQAARGNFRQAWAILKASSEDGAEQVQASITRILDFWDESMAEAPAMAAPFTAAIENIATTAKKSKDEVVSWGDAVNQTLNDLNADTTNDVARGINAIANETRAMSTVIEDAKAPLSELSTFAEQAARNMQDSFAQFLFDPFKEGVNGMLAGFLDTVRSMVAQLAAQELLRAFFTWGSGLGGGLGSFFGSMAGGISGTRAAGGPVSAGNAYLVGEKGPELFVPGASGQIVASGAMGGGVTVNYSIDARGADAERIMAMLPPLLAQSEARTVSQVRDLMRRGRLG